MESSNTQIVIHKDKNGIIKIDVRFDGEYYMTKLFHMDREITTE